MKVFKLEGTLRTDLGKKATKAARVAGNIPAVLYGGKEVTHFELSQESVRNLIYSPDVFLVELTLGGKMVRCTIKEMQFHPVTDRTLHMDFYEVTEGRPLEIAIPVVLEGHALGVRQGGKLNLDMRKIRVKAMYDQIPESLTINVAKLGLGKTIQIRDLNFDGLELTNAKNAVVCSVKLTRAARGMAAQAAAMDVEEEEETDE